MQYSVIFVNNSPQSGSVCLYQEDPEVPPGTMSLAWFAKNSFPGTTIVLKWSLDYSFVWAEVGMLAPGVVFQPSQLLSADPSGLNQVTFADQGGALTFENQRPGGAPGSLSIQAAASIPANQAAVGIGMSGAGTFATQAQPNMSYVFTPQPNYWIAFGSYTPGEVLDTGSIFNAARIDFPPGVYAVTATLNRDNSWTIEPAS